MKKLLLRSTCLCLLLIGYYGAIAQSTLAIKWQKCLGGSALDGLGDVLVTADGGFLVIGSATSNDGDPVGHHGGRDTSDAWIVKLNAAGNIQWQKCMGDDKGFERFRSVVLGADGNYICVGELSTPVPGVTGFHGAGDIWVVKFSPSGTILWNKAFGGSSQEYGNTVTATSDGGFAIIGTTRSYDGDVTNRPAGGGMDIWILKIDNAGNVVWQKTYSASNDSPEGGSDIMEDADGNLLAALHPIPGSRDFTFVDNNDFYLVKVDKNNGNIIYKKNLTGEFSVKGLLAKTSKGFFTSVSAVVNSSSCTLYNKARTKLHAANGDVISEILTPSSSNCTNLFTSAFSAPNGLLAIGDSSYIGVGELRDSGSGPTGVYGQTDACLQTGTFGVNGNRSAIKNYGGSGNDIFYSIKPIPGTDEFIAVGTTLSNDFDVSGNHGKSDGWIVRLAPSSNTITGNVFLDVNRNGIKDAGEKDASNAIIKSEKTGFSQYGLPYNGIYKNDVDTGTYITSTLLNKPYYTPVPASKTSAFAAYKGSDTINFALQPIPGMRDYSISVSAPEPARPGFVTTYNIVYTNYGTDTLVSKNVTVIKDSHTQVTSMTPAATTVSGDTLTWNVSSLLPASSGNIQMIVKLDSLPLVQIGGKMIARFYIDSTLDIVPGDNNASVRKWITGSYDPNDKQEDNAGTVGPDKISKGQHLTYTIRFQNTGNDTAFNIVVRDTLQSKVDAKSLEMVRASHPYQLNIKDGKYCTWLFSNIKLVDSVHNEPLSHGFITYRIKALPTLALGDTIKNNASIYFDFNPPVNTNTHLTIIKNPAPEVSGLLSTYCSTAGTQRGKINNLPPASSGVGVTVKMDATVLAVAADSTFGFNTATLSTGAHVLLVVFDSGVRDTLRLAINITAPIVPDVNVTANITTVVNLTDNVLITAVNAVGGGTSPLYTFARDRVFTNIIQPEGAANTLTIQPTSLVVGANWFYIRMKTSAACFTKQTDLDSIKIDRSSVTGLRDIDNPNQIINVYPNPFKQLININGLSTAKTYTVTINNLNGQQVYSQQISNRSSFSINKTALPGGSYWITIFDVKKKKIIGTVPLIKE